MKQLQGGFNLHKLGLNLLNELNLQKHVYFEIMFCNNKQSIKCLSQSKIFPFEVQWSDNKF